MYMKRNINIKFIWVLNVLLLVVVVFLGIEQGGIGAELSKLENSLEIEVTNKRNISENIFKEQAIENGDKIAELGFNKPNNIVYFDNQDVVAKLPVR